ncbi:hypothetical protein [Acinetobacter lanii]|uniref:DUF4209 domain-containing protein n=1 Tax=Acinetobacter lanii TaxID=2715163 RepID=A0A6G8S2I2_9GAMM|nr:hypothetical protein [Acinetobacter lanii]QIO08183.1 hypothetical protein G8D99_03500 [Acinetobacter lanii]
MTKPHNDRYDDFEHDDFQDDQFDREVTRIPQHKTQKVLGKTILELAHQYWQDIVEAEHSLLIQSLRQLAQKESYFDVLADELDQPLDAKIANDALNFMHFWSLIQKHEVDAAQFNLLELINTEYFQTEFFNAFDALEITERKAQRRVILQEAFKLYQLECYAGCIPVIYAQLEGLLTDVLIEQGFLKQSQTKLVDVYKIVPGLKGNEIKSLWHKSKIAGELNRYFAELAAYKMDSSSTVTMTRHNMLHGTDVDNFNQERSFILFIWLFSAVSFMSTLRK